MLQARLGRALSISTAKGQPNLGRRNSDPCAVLDNQRRAIERTKRITEVDDVGQHYDLGRDVMPSTHSYMKVQYAKRRSDGNEVVVKVRFKPNCFRSREDEKHWRQSTEFLLNIPDNCGIARLYEVLEDQKAFYIVMEKVDGMDLFETLEKQGKLDVSVAKEILRQLLLAMDHLHCHNAVHKDLKLENVMLDTSPARRGDPWTPTASVKVIDFDTLEEWTPHSPTSKDVVGTDQYIAQEAYAGKYSPLSDVFAIGVIAYRLLCGRFPFHEEIFDDEAGDNWVGSPKMAQIRRRLKVAKVDFSHQVFRDDTQACDLVSRMLAYTESNRPTAASALKHPWFTEEARNGSSTSGRSIARYNESEDLLDDGIIIAQEAVVGDDRLQALQRQ